MTASRNFSLKIVRTLLSDNSTPMPDNRTPAIVIKYQMPDSRTLTTDIRTLYVVPRHPTVEPHYPTVEPHNPTIERYGDSRTPRQ
ncbi:hypothetical protein OUZ56_005376 [Daphnia magna]|uniref:Uncharacterized protein n=1 Tax=Daphnia magna TaxID=35525 RepID=A0ABQ9YSL5_9CRUS|nr:hypothetical protein OUZ56_005376 [Daphnia magna]